jgi:hypothetical protein
VEKDLLLNKRIMKLKINRQHILFTEEEEVEKITYKE